MFVGMCLQIKEITGGQVNKMIKLESVNFRYKNDKDILQDINLEIKDGEFISIIGKNGSR